VDDAIYLRDNFNAEGGAHIISKYSGKAPVVHSLSLSPTAFIGEGADMRPNVLIARSRLQSPTRFLKQQGGVEALLQGAAKGVFDRGEKLGINQAVRDAVADVKKNMQGLQAASRANSKTRGPSDVTRWSLDEGRAVPISNKLESAMKSRNKRLARMLDEAMAELRDASLAKDGDEDNYIKAMDIAVAKVGFVKVYLEDSTMSLPPISNHDGPDGSSPAAELDSNASPPTSSHIRDSKASPLASPESKPGTPRGPSLAGTPTPVLPSRGASPAVKSPADAAQEPTLKKPEVGHLETSPAKSPAAPLPTRASIAQSNFSWMLEPDSNMASSPKSPSPKAVSPFLKSGRRPASTSGRDKAAFLFGEDGDVSRTSAAEMPTQREHEEGFSLEPMRSSSD
jgi:TBC1 domain family member 5